MEPVEVASRQSPRNAGGQSAPSTDPGRSCPCPLRMGHKLSSSEEDVGNSGHRALPPALAQGEQERCARPNGVEKMTTGSLATVYHSGRLASLLTYMLVPSPGQTSQPVHTGAISTPCGFTQPQSRTSVEYAVPHFVSTSTLLCSAQTTRANRLCLKH